MLLAIDIAILLPQEISQRAIELSAALPRHESIGLLLGEETPPHVTLTQQFVPADEIDSALDRAGATLAGVGSLPLTIAGPGRGPRSVCIVVEPTPALTGLHQRLMDALREFEHDQGTQAAFVNGDARPSDVQWVAGFRRNSSYQAFTPHITLGHAATLPSVEPVTFDATTIAACHLGRFCTCRRVLRQWEL